MIASLGASLLFILLFFTGLCTMLVVAVHIESTLQPPRRRRAVAPAPTDARRVEASAPGSE